MSARRVLLTNCWLVNRAGTELYVRDVAVGLAARGLEPIVWSPLVGPMAEEIRAAGVQVVDDLDAVDDPVDLVHGQHHDETLAALARFPDRPGIFVQHGAVPWQEEAPLHPRLLRYVAVDELCRQRLLTEGVDASRVRVIPNSVDLDRFLPRDPLPARPRRALVLSNTARDDTYLPAIRGACGRAGIELDVRGLGVGQPSSCPERDLRCYDVVFAKARAALEAIAVGCAVVVVDEVGLAGMATSERLDDWLPWNLGRQLLAHPHEAGRLDAELARYDPDDAARCRDHVRTHRGLPAMLDSLSATYESAIEEWAAAPTPDHRAELRALSTQLSKVGPLRADGDVAAEAAEHCARQAAVLAHTQAQLADLQEAMAALQDTASELAAHNDALRQRRAVRWVDAVVARRPGRIERP